MKPRSPGLNHRRGRRGVLRKNVCITLCLLDGKKQRRHLVTPPGKLLPGPLAIWTPGRNPLALSDAQARP